MDLEIQPIVVVNLFSLHLYTNKNTAIQKIDKKEEEKN